MKKQSLEERIEYVRQQLAACGHLDGWVTEGFKQELERLENKAKKSNKKFSQVK